MAVSPAPSCVSRDEPEDDDDRNGNADQPEQNGTHGVPRCCAGGNAYPASTVPCPAAGRREKDHKGDSFPSRPHLRSNPYKAPLEYLSEQAPQLCLRRSLGAV